jgi:hypothetical protein
MPFKTRGYVRAIYVAGAKKVAGVQGAVFGEALIYS